MGGAPVPPSSGRRTEERVDGKRPPPSTASASKVKAKPNNRLRSSNLRIDGTAVLLEQRTVQHKQATEHRFVRKSGHDRPRSASKATRKQQNRCKQEQHQHRPPSQQHLCKGLTIHDNKHLDILEGNRENRDTTVAPTPRSSHKKGSALRASEILGMLPDPPRFVVPKSLVPADAFCLRPKWSRHPMPGIDHYASYQHTGALGSGEHRLKAESSRASGNLHTSQWTIAAPQVVFPSAYSTPSASTEVSSDAPPSSHQGSASYLAMSNSSYQARLPGEGAPRRAPREGGDARGEPPLVMHPIFHAAAADRFGLQRPSTAAQTGDSLSHVYGAPHPRGAPRPQHPALTPRRRQATRVTVQYSPSSGASSMASSGASLGLDRRPLVDLDFNAAAAAAPSLSKHKLSHDLSGSQLERSRIPAIHNAGRVIETIYVPTKSGLKHENRISIKVKGKASVTVTFDEASL